jgi:5-methyltetrahydropteroyltriglutamate--homocysteine methyltransferase
MLRSTDRIMTTHAGALPRAEALRALVFARSNHEPYDKASLATSLRDAVVDIVRKQIEIGIDSINDGELGKSNFTNYIHERLAGIEARAYQLGQDTGFTSLIRREIGRYGDYYRKMTELFPRNRRPNFVCVGPLKYAGEILLEEDIANFKAALGRTAVTDAFLPAVTPGTIEHWLA